MIKENQIKTIVAELDEAWLRQTEADSIRGKDVRILHQVMQSQSVGWLSKHEHGTLIMNRKWPSEEADQCNP